MCTGDQAAKDRTDSKFAKAKTPTLIYIYILQEYKARSQEGASYTSGGRVHSNLLVVDSKKKEKGYRHLVNSNKIDWIESKMERRGRVRTGCGQKVFRWIFSQASWLL